MEKKATVLPSLDRHVDGDVQGQGRLAHRRPGGDDDQVAVLETGDHGVQVVKIRFSDPYALPVLLDGLDVVHRVGNQLAGRHETLLDPVSPKS